jgi:hypothetical protein
LSFKALRADHFSGARDALQKLICYYFLEAQQQTQLKTSHWQPQVELSSRGIHLHINGFEPRTFFLKKVPDNTVERSPPGALVLENTNFELQTHLITNLYNPMMLEGDFLYTQVVESHMD